MVITHDELLQEHGGVLLFIPAEFFVTNVSQLFDKLLSFFRPHNPISKCPHSFVAEDFCHSLLFFPLFIIRISLENDLFVVSKYWMLNQIAAEFCNELETMKLLQARDSKELLIRFHNLYQLHQSIGDQNIKALNHITCLPGIRRKPVLNERFETIRVNFFAVQSCRVEEEPFFFVWGGLEFWVLGHHSAKVTNALKDLSLDVKVALADAPRPEEL